MIKETVKDAIANGVYQLYRMGILKTNLKVKSIDETIDELLHTEKSLVRFGDSDIILIMGKNILREKANPDLIANMKRIIGYEHDGLMVSLYDIFGSLEMFQSASKHFWKDHLLLCRRVYEKYCSQKKEYCNTAVSRCYYMFQDKSRAGEQFSRIRQIWKDKDVVVVEGTGTHNGVGNDLLDTAASVERIIGPKTHAYQALDRILEKCRSYQKDRLFLVSLGSPAKVLVEKLFLDGYRVIDIGNLDMEYEWFLSGTLEKAPVKKHNITGEEANRAAGYIQYMKEIRAWIE